MSGAVVIGLDSSTQSTKAVAWDRDGRSVAEGRADVPMQNPRIGYFEQDPADWWHSSVAALQACTGALGDRTVEGLAISNQRETLGCFDADGEPTRPAMVWLDERAADEVERFPDSFGRDEIHRITGRPPDLTSCLYRLVWMRDRTPNVFANSAMFADVQATLVRQLCGGAWRTGWISADPFGLFDLVEKRWSVPLLDALGLDADRFPEALPPGTELGRVTDAAAQATGLAPGTPVFAAGGDGQCAGLGTNCTVPDRAYVNLGTAVVHGIWSPDYRYNNSWRTELAAQGHGYIYESCLRSGAFLVNWFVDRFVAAGKADAAVFDRLEQGAASLPIGSDGLLVSPYFSGVMDPHWDVGARGVMLGLSGSHTQAHLYRAILEAITLDVVMGTLDMERAADQEIDHYVAIGGGANSSLWREMLADASGKPVRVSETVEASALGAGMVAAYGAGWYDSIDAAASAMAGSTVEVAPNTDRTAIYGELLDIFRDLYGATASLNDRMADFSRKHRSTSR